MVTTSTPVDLTRGYDPLPAQEAFHQSEASFRMFSGGFGSGKTKAGCRESIFHSVMFPGSRNMVARLAYRPLWRSTMVTYQAELREMGLHTQEWSTFRKSDMELEFWNGSVTVFTNLDDVENFKSQELDTVFIDEGAEVPDEVYDILLPGRLRGKAGVNLTGNYAGRGWITTNPGASGWIRRNFVHPEPGSLADPEEWAWFHAPTYENIHNPQGYNEGLAKKYKGPWFRRFVEGDWTAFEGQVFPQFEPSTHVLSTDWRPNPRERSKWTIYEGWDFGFVNPTAVVWMAVHREYEWPPIVFGEYSEPGRTVEENARAVLRLRESLGIKDWDIWSYGDPIGRTSIQSTGRSFNAEYSAYGIDIVPSEREPSIRAIRLAQHLDEHMRTNDGWYPCVVFNPSLRQTIDSIQYLRWKPNTSNMGEDPQEKFLKQNDHTFDALTYALIQCPQTNEFQSFNQPNRRPDRLPQGIGMPAHYDDERGVMSLATKRL